LSSSPSNSGPDEELRHNAAKRPHVHHGIVVLLPQEHLQRHVPSRSDLLVGRPVGDRGGEPDVTNLDRDGLTAGDEDVTGLDVTVHDPARVHVPGPVQELPHDAAHIRLRERTAAAVPDVVQDVVEVGPGALHDECVLGRAAVDGSAWRPTRDGWP
jgi:hypothetical protein